MAKKDPPKHHKLSAYVREEGLPPALKAKHPGRTGRPSTYSEKVASRLVELISNGMTQTQAERVMGIDGGTIARWRVANKDFHAQLLHARENRLDKLEDELTDIADNGVNDWIEWESKNGTKVLKLNDEAVQRSRLRVETRLKILAALRPERYGKKLDVTSAGKQLGSLGEAMTNIASDFELEAPQVVAH